MSINAVFGGLNRPKTNHYRFTHRTVLTALQAAGSRLLEIRNPSPTGNAAPSELVLVRLQVKWLQTAAHTAAIEDSIDVFRATAFTVDATTNTATPLAIPKRTGMAATPNAAIRGLAAAGNAAGMTGGTLTPDASPFSQLPQWLLAAQPTASTVPPVTLDEDGQAAAGENHPFVFAPGEGISVQLRAVLGAAAGSSVYFEVDFAEFPK
jgi:hypothetical protein